MIPRCLCWPLFALAMGFVLGGSVFWALYGPNITEAQANAAFEETITNADPKTDWIKVASDVGLVVFTGLLVLATVGPYRTGEKQIDLTRILQRGYIGVQPSGIVERPNQLTKCHANIEIENVGNLPVQHVRWIVTWTSEENAIKREEIAAPLLKL